MKQSMGEFLATLRRANGFTQQEVAEKLGVSNRTLSSWETDRTAPDLLILPAIADLYGVTADEILRGERKAAEESAAVISDGAKRNLKKRRFAKFGTRRLFCLGFALLGSLIFLAACAVMLYSSAPLWLSVLLMVIGAGGTLACVILLACFAYSAVKSEGLVLKEDYTEENKPYALCVRRSVANSLFWLSLPHILGAIVFLIVFFAAGYYDYNVELVWVSVEIDYMTPTVTLVCLNAAFALAFFVSGLVLNLSGVFGFGSEGQRAAVKSNGKLLGKIAGFSAIPIVVALVLCIVFQFVYPKESVETYFTASTADEVYKKFQTKHVEETYEVYNDSETGDKITLEAGDYFLNFQSEDEVLLDLWSDGHGHSYKSFRDLGNGFYGCRDYGSDWDWSVYHLYDGLTAADITEDEFYGNFMQPILIHEAETIYAYAGDVDWVANLNYPRSSIPDEDGWQGEDLCTFKWIRALNYTDGNYIYESYFIDNYSLPFLIVFVCTAGAAVVADTIAYFIKRKRTEYSF